MELLTQFRELGTDIGRSGALIILRKFTLRFG